MQRRLEQRLQTVQGLAGQAKVSDAGREKLAKARRVLPRLLASLVWFWHSMRLLVESLELSEAAERAVYEQLLPGLYWTAAAERARTAADKKRLRGLAATCLEKAWSGAGVLNGLGEELKGVVKQVAAEGVSRFVRSSSCVDGSTAAERFFGQKPAGLFEWLLERFPDPPRPAKQGRKAAKVASVP
jgi:hypothetical protein